MGRLKPEAIPFSGPAWGALYPPPPHFYRNTSNLILSYETDLEAVLDFLPEGVEPLGQSPRVYFWFQDTPFSSFGPHQAAYAFIECSHDGTPYLFEALLWVSSESAMAAGRELWGDSKKLGDVTLEFAKEEIVATLERPAGVRVATARMRLEGWGDASSLPPHPGLCLKMIPDARSPRSHLVLQLVTDESTLSPVIGSDGRAEIYRGSADIELTTAITLDPVGRLKPTGPITATYARLHMELDFGRLVKDYLSPSAI